MAPSDHLINKSNQKVRQVKNQIIKHKAEEEKVKHIGL